MDELAAKGQRERRDFSRRSQIPQDRRSSRVAPNGSITSAASRRFDLHQGGCQAIVLDARMTTHRRDLAVSERQIADLRRRIAELGTTPNSGFLQPD